MKESDESESLPQLRPTASMGMAPSNGNPGNSVGGFGKLAKRITGITSNCLFTAIVLVAGLGIGRQILRWWSADAPRQSASPQNSELPRGLGDPSRLHFLQFGRQGWSMARREFQGSLTGAEEQLRRDCREQIETAASPLEKPTPEQTKLLETLAKMPAIDAEPPRWQLFAPDRNNKLILVGVKPPLAKDTVEQDRKIGSSRVVLWGIALAKGSDAWSLLLFIPSSGGGDSIPLLPDIPIPPKCRKMLSVQAVNGGAMVGFSGPGEPTSWREHFEKSFARGGWKPIFPWQSTASAWYAQYRGLIKGKNIVVDLHLHPDSKGGMAGLAIVGVVDEE
ncbi:MAG: hypothetical protein IT426_06430 [Pirellulales bacterium]|nr:hypothetical protein [Pirellulales bacterium]